MNHAYHEWPKILIHTDPSKCAVHPEHGRVVRVGMVLRLVSVGMSMDVASVVVMMRVEDFLFLVIVDGPGRHRAQKTGYIH